MNDENRTYKLAGHIIRWFLEIIVLWVFVFPETGPWTCVVLTMITIGIEWDHIDFRLFRKNASVK